MTKTIAGLALSALIYACQAAPDTKLINNKSSEEKKEQVTERDDSLFRLDKERFNNDNNYVVITAPKGSDFSLPDSAALLRIVKSGDFNADHKKDLLISMGACGTGGCMHGLFLNQYGNYYKLVYMDYLKNPTFKPGKKGYWEIRSYEEVKPYQPEESYVSVFTFNPKEYRYQHDSTFIYRDPEFK